MPKYVRVSDLDTGWDATVLESEAANGNYEVLDGVPVLDCNGDPLPPQRTATQPPVEHNPPFGHLAGNPKENS